MIKRTFYQESIVSGTNVEVPELKTLLETSTNVTATYATTTKSSLTTRVTLNMRKCRRRSSDVGLIGQHRPAEGQTDDTACFPRMSDVRHSICGSPVPFLCKHNSAEPTSGRRLEQISDEKRNDYASSLMVSNNPLQTSVSSVLTGVLNGKVRFS